MKRIAAVLDVDISQPILIAPMVDHGEISDRCSSFLMLDPLSQRQKSSEYNAEGGEIRPGRSLIVRESKIGLRILPCGVTFSKSLYH